MTGCQVDWLCEEGDLVFSFVEGRGEEGLCSSISVHTFALLRVSRKEMVLGVGLI